MKRIVEIPFGHTREGITNNSKPTIYATIDDEKISLVTKKGVAEAVIAFKEKP